METQHSWVLVDSQIEQFGRVDLLKNQPSGFG